MANFVGATRPGASVHTSFTGDTSGLRNAVNQATSMLSSFGKQMKNATAGIATAFGVGAIANSFGNFLSDSVKLASTLQGVEEAFKRIARPGLLRELQEATRGTVDNLQLMRQTVRANNFQIPLEQLATLFEFATKRAAQTGESVDYLVESIILGIGRKSPLILDNLGISAVRLREKLRGVGVETASVGEIAKIMGEIIDEEMAKMGDVTLTAAQKLQKMNAEFTNMKLEIGKGLAPVAGNFFDKITEEIKVTTKELLTLGDAFDRIKKKLAVGSGGTKGPRGEDKTFWEELWDLNGFSRTGIKLWPEVEDPKMIQDMLDKFRQSTELWPTKESFVEFLKIKEELGDLTGILEILQDRLKSLKEQQLEATASALAGINQEISAVEKQIKYYSELGLHKREAELPPMTGTFGTPTTVGEPPDAILGRKILNWGDFFNKGTQGFGQLSEVTTGFFMDFRDNGELMQDVLDDIHGKLVNTIGTDIELFQQFANSIGAAIGEAVSALVRGEVSLEDALLNMVATIIQSAFSIIAAYFAQSVAAGFAGGASAGGPLAPITGAAVAAATVASFLASVPAVGMASGGIVPGGYPNDTYPALLTSGEVVVPPGKLDSVLGRNQVIVLDTVIRGEDIYLVQQKQASKNARYK